MISRHSIQWKMVITKLDVVWRVVFISVDLQRIYNKSSAKIFELKFIFQRLIYKGNTTNLHSKFWNWNLFSNWWPTSSPLAELWSFRWLCRIGWSRNGCSKRILNSTKMLTKIMKDKMKNKYSCSIRRLGPQPSKS